MMSEQDIAVTPSEMLIPKKSMRWWVIISILIELILIGAYLAMGYGDRNEMIIWGVLAAILLVVIIITFMGRTLPGQIIAPLSLGFSMLFMAFKGDGLHDVILLGSPLAIVLAGLLLGNWGTIFLGIALTLGIAAIGLNEVVSQEPAMSSTRVGFVNIITSAILIIVLTLLQFSLLNYFSQRLKRLRRGEQDLLRSNHELRESLDELEKGIDERTRLLGRRAQQLQAAAEVSKAVASIRDLNELLSRVTQQISEQFGYYHVGVFLLDPAGENAVLRAANSTGGQRLLIRKHSLPVGSKSIVGYTMAQVTPRIAMDVGQDAVFFDNPDLPETRSEMALPLISGGKLLGALDVQSVEENAFTQDDIEVLQVLADQVAIAIENSNLFAESHQALEASRRAYGDLSRQAWMDILRGRNDLGYWIDSRGNLQPVSGEWSDELLDTLRSGKPIRSSDGRTLMVPFSLLDIPIGIVKMRKHPGTSEWNNREIALVEGLVTRLGDALESARLYEDSQRRAERERISADIATRIRESLDVDTVLQTAVVEMRRALNLEEITIRLGESNGQSSS